MWQLIIEETEESLKKKKKNNLLFESFNNAFKKKNPTLNQPSMRLLMGFILDYVYQQSAYTTEPQMYPLITRMLMSKCWTSTTQ